MSRIYLRIVAASMIIVASLSLLLTYGGLSSTGQRGNVLKASNYAVLESAPATPGLRPVTLFVQWRLKQTHDRFM